MIVGWSIRSSSGRYSSRSGLQFRKARDADSVDASSSLSSPARLGSNRIEPPRIQTINNSLFSLKSFGEDRFQWPVGKERSCLESEIQTLNCGMEWRLNTETQKRPLCGTCVNLERRINGTFLLTWPDSLTINFIE